MRRDYFTISEVGDDALFPQELGAQLTTKPERMHVAGEGPGEHRQVK